MHTTKASSTALLIAECLVYSGEDPVLRSFLAAEQARLSYEYLGEALGPRIASFLRRLLRCSGIRRSLAVLEYMSVPGLLLHVLLRKRLIEDLVRQAAKNQLVIVGAGADTLGIRLALEANSPRVWEIDHPATQTLKAAMIKRLDLMVPRLQLIPADLAKESLESVLTRSEGFSFAKPTMLVAEGLFMYLPLSAVAETLSLLHLFSMPPGFICTYMGTNLRGDIGFTQQRSLVKCWLQHQQEPFLWGMSSAEWQTWLATLALQVGASYTADDQRQRYLHGELRYKIPLASGEVITLLSCGRERAL